MKARTLRGERWAQRLLDSLSAPADLRQWMTDNTQILKRNETSLVGLLRLDGELNYLKLYQSKSALQSLAFGLGKGRAVHSFDVSRELFDRGLPVPEPRACVKLGNQQLLLKQGLEGSQDLNQRWLDGMDDGEQRHWMQRCGDALGRLHDQGFAHGDAKWTNLLCQSNRLWLVDLDGVGRAGASARMRDLARFTLNAEDRELDPEYYDLFLAHYIVQTGDDRDALLRELVFPLKKLRARHVKQYGQRGRRLVN